MIEAPIFLAFDCGIAPAGVRKSIIQLLSIITRGCDKKCLFWNVAKVLGVRYIGWNVAKVLLMLGSGCCGALDTLECSWSDFDARIAWYVGVRGGGWDVPKVLGVLGVVVGIRGEDCGRWSFLECLVENKPMAHFL